MNVSSRVLFCLFSACAAPLFAQKFPANEELRHIRSLSDPQLSPDLKHVVAMIQESTADGGVNHLWLLSTEGGAPRQLTFSAADAGGERAPQYTPDGTAILFSARRDGKSQLMRLPLDGGEAYPVKVERPGGRVGTPAGDPAKHSDTDGHADEHQRAAPRAGGGEDTGLLDLSAPSFSPDGKTMAVIVADPEPPAHAAEVRDKKDVIWYEHDERTRRLYLVDFATLKARVVPTLADIDAVTWSEDSQRLLAITHLRNRDLGPSSVATIVQASDLTQQTRVAGFPESARRAVFTHDGKQLVLFSKCAQDAPEGCSDMYTLDLLSGKLRNVTGGLKESTINPGSVVVADDDKTVMVGLSHGMHETVAQIDIATGSVKRMDLGLPVITAVRSDRAKKGWVYLGSSSTSPAALYFTHTPDQPGTRLNQPQLQPTGWASVPSKTVTWKRAGFTIEGLLYLPPQAAAGKVPLVVNVHGGPRGQFSDGYSPLTDLLLGQGWAVLNTNPRGSTGYGVAFEAANKDDMGNGDYLDIMMGVDEVIKTAPIDASRMALIGYSYGGEMAGFVEGKTDRFKAIVAGAPVIDQFSEYGTESGSYGDRWYTGQPWRHFESAWRQSPLAYASHAKTPFLLLQGQSDTTDPEGQSKEMYRALRQEGVPVQMLLFPREDHGALGSNFAGRPSPEPYHGLIAREHMLKFITDGFAGKIEPNKP